MGGPERCVNSHEAAQFSRNLLNYTAFSRISRNRRRPEMVLGHRSPGRPALDPSSYPGPRREAGFPDARLRVMVFNRINNNLREG